MIGRSVMRAMRRVLARQRVRRHRGAREQLDLLASLVGDRSEVDGLRGAIALVAYAIEGLAVAMGQLAPDGSRRR
jgi:hypothetical protein